MWGSGRTVVGHSRDMAKNSGIQNMNPQQRPQSWLDAVTMFSRPKEKKPRKMV